MVHSQISQFLPNLAKIRENIRQRTFAEHLLWKAKLLVRIQEAVCECDPRTVLSVPCAQKTPAAYGRARRGIQRPLGQAPWSIC
eukprot:3571165-Pyramimonas_sp.AAC.1